MTITTFTPPVPPSASGTQKSVVPRVRRTAFGDGYSQRAPDGLNIYPRKVTLAWGMLGIDEAQEIEAFFESRGGSAPFVYTLPDEAVARKWTVTSWASGFIDGTLMRMSAELVEEFDP